MRDWWAGNGVLIGKYQKPLRMDAEIWSPQTSTMLKIKWDSQEYQEPCKFWWENLEQRLRGGTNYSEDVLSWAEIQEDIWLSWLAT